MRRYFVMLLLILVAFAPEAVGEHKTITDFESSAFYKNQSLVKKWPVYDLRTGGQNNPYSFKDSENPYDAFGIDLTTRGQDIVRVSIQWHGQSAGHPPEFSEKKVELIKEIAYLFGLSAQSKRIVEYAKSQQSKNYPGGSGVAPRKSLGKISVHCGTTGADLWIVLEIGS